MSARLALGDIRDRLASALDANVTVGTVHERQFTEKADKSFPGVWVGGQTLTALDRGERFSSLMRQRVRVQFGVRVIVRRSEAGINDPEAHLNALIDAVSTALLGWLPDGAQEPLVWSQTQDESPVETTLSAVLIFETTLAYSVPTT